MHGLAVLRVPTDHYVVVHSASGDPLLDNPYLHASSMVDALISQAKAIDAQPVAFALHCPGARRRSNRYQDSLAVASI